MKRLLALVALVPICVACSQPDSQNGSQSITKGNMPRASAGLPSPGPMPPMASAANDPETVKKSEKVLDGLKKNYDTAKGVYEKKKDNKTAKEAFLTAAVTYGHESMMSPALEPKVKYRQALKIYREVLKIDPTNEVAKKESDLIVSIYESMGRPVPQD